MKQTKGTFFRFLLFDPPRPSACNLPSVPVLRATALSSAALVPGHTAHCSCTLHTQHVVKAIVLQSSLARLRQTAGGGGEEVHGIITTALSKLVLADPAVVRGGWRVRASDSSCWPLQLVDRG